MNQSLRHISYRRLGASEVHLGYLEDDQEIQNLLGARPRDAADLLRRAPMNARRLVPPSELGQAFAAYAERHDAPQEVLDNARRVGEEEAYVVVTGQQPGLFGGPLYAVHKAATAIRLARDLSAEPGAPQVVPVFWNHSDDHDLDEVNRSFLVNASLDLQRVRLDIPYGGEPIRDVRVGRAMEAVLASVREILPDTEFREWALEMLEPKHPDEQFGDAMARLLFGMFGKYGLLVIEPRDLPDSAFEILPRWCEMADDIRGRIQQVTEHLTDVGFDVTLDPGTTMMFQCAGERRLSLADGESVSRARDLSPGVLLRPAWQDAIMPSIGFVVGPGELSYLAVVAPLYKMLGVPQPAFVPRASLTLVERPVAKLLKRFSWDLPELGRGAEALVKEAGVDSEQGPEDAISGLVETIQAEMASLTTKLKESDPQMVGVVERSRAKIVEDLQKLQTKLRSSRQDRVGTGLRQIRRLCNHLRPRGRMQERVIPVLPYLVNHGPALADLLVEAADPFATNHGVLEL